MAALRLHTETEAEVLADESREIVEMSRGQRAQEHGQVLAMRLDLMHRDRLLPVEPLGRDAERSEVFDALA